MAARRMTQGKKDALARHLATIPKRWEYHAKQNAIQVANALATGQKCTIKSIDASGIWTRVFVEESLQKWVVEDILRDIVGHTSVRYNDHQKCAMWVTTQQTR